MTYTSLCGSVEGPYGRAGRRPRAVEDHDRGQTTPTWLDSPSRGTSTRQPIGSSGTPEDPNRLRFDVQTAGRGQALFLELEDAGPATQDHRPPAAAKKDFVFQLAELEDGPEESEIPFGQSTDTVSARLVPDDGALDQDFVFTDTGDLKPDDYYYMRVRQLDGAIAWSSPFWVEE